MMKKINSVSDFISVIEKIENESYLFRGENSNYNEQKSSAFRVIRTVKGECEYPFINMINEFSREISEPICDKEILAFAQHSGIPTNLLDVTSNPLVALYFSVSKGSNKKESNNKDGYIYMLDTQNIVDITSTIQQLGKNNLLDEIYHCNEIIIKTFMSDLLNSSTLNLSMYEEKLKHELEIISSEWALTEKEEMLKTFDNEVKIKQSSINKSIPIDYRDVINYIICLQRFLSYCKNNYLLPNFSGLPIMKYTPIMSFKRGTNQQSQFIYQNYLAFDDEIFNHHYLAIQSINFNKKITVSQEAKKDILKTLDQLNINQKFIFNDSDSIANYIANKYK